jgi:hypothetical protein
VFRGSGFSTERRECMRRGVLLTVFLIVFSFFSSSPVGAGIGDFLKGIQKSMGGREELSESKIIEGLKEALEVGTKNAVEAVSKTDGYYGNPEIKIPLPDAVQKAKKMLQAVGYGPKVEAFELSMNRAAETAAPEAKNVFWDAIKAMTFTDAREILDGRENEATLYFKDKTQDRLNEIFKPIVHDAMGKVGVTRSYQELDAKVRTIPFAEPMAFDLDQYVTDKALSGLFTMLAEEERKIRQEPAARFTELLKEVFSKQ